MTAIGQRTSPDLDVASFYHAVGLLSEQILIDGIHLVVAEQVDGEFIHLSNVATDEHIRSQQGPEGNMRVLLVGRQAAVAQVRAPSHLTHNQHVGVVPVAGSGVGSKSCLLTETDIIHRTP